MLGPAYEPMIEADDPDGWLDPAGALVDSCGDHWTCHTEPPTCGH